MNPRFYTTLILLVTVSAAVCGAQKADAATLAKPANNLGLVGYWSFNEGTSTIVGDYSGRGNNGTFTASGWVDGKFNKAGSFNGSTSYVSGSGSALPNIGASADVTISAWVKRTSGGGIVFSKGSSGVCFNYGLVIGSSGGVHARNTNGDYQTGTATIGTDTWSHVVVVYTSSGAEGFINGVSIGTNTTPKTSNCSNNNWSIGRRAPNASSEYFTGHIDEIRIFHRALTNEEIASLYRGGSNAARSPVATNTGLVLHWPFEDATGTVAQDISGNGKRGTLTCAGTSCPLPVWTSGRNGTVLYFNPTVVPGQRTYVSTSAINVPSTPGSKVTWSMWLKPDSSQPGGGWFMRTGTGTDENSGLNLSGPSGGLFKISFTGHDGTTFRGITTTNNILPAEEWSHVAVTYSQDEYIDVYVNGEFKEQVAWTYDPTVQGGSLVIGGNPGSTGQSYNGYIDDVRIYNRGLTASEIAAIAQSNTVRVNTSTTNLQGNGTLAEGLVGLWTFDGPDTTDKIYDRSGQGRNGYLFGAATTTAKSIGKLGQALRFGGAATEFVRASGFSELGTANQPYTIATWIKPAAASATGNVIHVSSGAAGTSWCLSMIQMASGKAKLLSWTSSPSTVTGNTTLTPNEWHHIVHTWSSSGGLQLYVNGALDNSTPQASFSASGSSNYVFIGGPSSGTSCSSSAGSVGFAGEVDDTRIYNRALTADEVEQLYNLGR